MKKGTFVQLLAAIFFFAVNAGALCAAPDDIKVRAEINKAFLTIGDPVTYTVTVEHSPEIKILSRIPAPDSDVLEIKKVEDISQKAGKKMVTGRRFQLTTYKLGEFVLDPVDIKYQKEGQPEKTIQTNKIYLKVKSIAEGETKEDIRDVKPVVPLTRHYGWIMLLAGLAAAAGVIFLIVQKLRQKQTSPGNRESPLTAEEEALKDLRGLFDSDLLKRGFVKLYYLKLSEILRVYLERRYKVLAVESTTFEIMRAMKSLRLPKELSEKIEYVLASSDLAKFAKWVPAPAETITLNKKSEEIVLDSKPAEVTEAPAAPILTEKTSHGV